MKRQQPLPRDSATFRVVDELCRAWFESWLEPPFTSRRRRDALLRAVRQARADLHALAGARGVSGRRLERLSRCVFEKFRGQFEATN